MFWLAIDAIGQYLMIEKYSGKWRVCQTFVMQYNNGYNAAQWCFGDTRDKPIWSKWGGGKILADKDINNLLDIVVKWQQLIRQVLPALLCAVPGIHPEAMSHLPKPRLEPDSQVEMIGADWVVAVRWLL